VRVSESRLTSSVKDWSAPYSNNISINGGDFIANIKAVAPPYDEESKRIKLMTDDALLSRLR
jgi:hypothetical protein